MSSFRVPSADQQKVLLFGIVFALIARTGLIFVGAGLINRFAWVFYFFGLILLLTARSHRSSKRREPIGGRILAVLGLPDTVRCCLFDLDGVTIAEQVIPGKPASDSFLAGAAKAGVTREQAAVFEDATSGVAAGRRGGFDHVVGVNRLGDPHARTLRDHRADMVVTDLRELL